MPEIRFKDFTNPWKQQKLGDITKVNSGKDYKHLNQGDIPVYGTGGYMLSVNESLSNEDAVGIGRKGTIDKPQFLKAPFWTVDTLFFMTPKPNNELMFLLALSQDIEWAKLDESTGVPSLSKVNIESVVRYVPDFHEQTAIGTFFRVLDDTISIHKRKLDGLRKLKKAYLQQMFPQAGEKVPRIRFEGFTDDWKMRRLSDMSDYKNGKGHEDKIVENGKYELVNLNSISIDGGLKSSYKFIDEATETLQKGDLVMVLSDVGRGDLLGRVAIIPEDNKFVLNQRVALLRPNETANSLFLFSYINAHQRYFKLKGAGMSQLNISKGSVEGFESYVPTLAEQIAIGNFFCNLDMQIQTQSEKIEKLKQLKSAYLQKMFV